jgi:hypothetical protein
MRRNPESCVKRRGTKKEKKNCGCTGVALRRLQKFLQYFKVEVTPSVLYPALPRGTCRFCCCPGKWLSGWGRDAVISLGGSDAGGCGANDGGKLVEHQRSVVSALPGALGVFKLVSQSTHKNRYGAW